MTASSRAVSGHTVSSPSTLNDSQSSHLEDRRWLMHYRDGYFYAKEVEAQGFVMTHAKVAELIKVYPNPVFFTDTVLEIAQACLERLAKESYEQQANTSAPSSKNH